MVAQSVADSWQSALDAHDAPPSQPGMPPVPAELELLEPPVPAPPAPLELELLELPVLAPPVALALFELVALAPPAPLELSVLASPLPEPGLLLPQPIALAMTAAATTLAAARVFDVLKWNLPCATRHEAAAAETRPLGPTGHGSGILPRRVFDSAEQADRLRERR